MAVCRIEHKHASRLYRAIKKTEPLSARAEQLLDDAEWYATSANIEASGGNCDGARLRLQQAQRMMNAAAYFNNVFPRRSAQQRRRR